MDEWQAAQHADETALQQDIGRALDAALVRPLSLQEAELLAWASGISADFARAHNPT